MLQCFLCALGFPLHSFHIAFWYTCFFKTMKIIERVELWWVIICSVWKCNILIILYCTCHKCFCDVLTLSIAVAAIKEVESFKLYHLLFILPVFCQLCSLIPCQWRILPSACGFEVALGKLSELLTTSSLPRVTIGTDLTEQSTYSTVWLFLNWLRFSNSYFRARLLRGN